jgi:hypothetical protein
MHYNGSKYIVQSAYRPSGGSWEAPAELSQPGEEAGDPQIALDAHGDAMVVWDSSPSEYEDVARAAYRPAGGSWQVPVNISAEGEQVQQQTMRVALDARGDALVAWTGSTREVGQYGIVQAAYRPADGVWETPVSLSEDGSNAYPSDLVFDAAGNAAVLWQRNNGTNEILQADYRPAGGSWQTPTNLSKEGSNATDAVLVLDAPGDETIADGDATAVWVAGNDGDCGERLDCVGSYLVQAAGYDVNEAPAEEGLEVPTTGTVGTPVEVSVPTTDVWSPVLEFGDGTSISDDTRIMRADSQLSHSTVTTDGATAVHTYSQPGRYSVTFSGTEVLGYRTSARRTIVIASAKGSSDPEGGLSGSEGESSSSKGGSSGSESGLSGSKGGSSGSESGLSGSNGGSSGPESEQSGQQSSPGGEVLGGSTGTVALSALPAMAPTPLVLRLNWVRQTRRAIIRAGAIRIVCHMNAPGVCVVHGATGHGRTRLSGAGGRAVMVTLTYAALQKLRAGHDSKLTFVVSASASNNRAAVTTVTLALP